VAFHLVYRTQPVTERGHIALEKNALIESGLLLKYNFTQAPSLVWQIEFFIQTISSYIVSFPLIKFL